MEDLKGISEEGLEIKITLHLAIIAMAVLSKLPEDSYPAEIKKIIIEQRDELLRINKELKRRKE